MGKIVEIHSPYKYSNSRRMHVTLKSSLQLQPADNFSEVCIYSDGLAFASFGLTQLFSGGGLPAPGGAVRCPTDSTGSRPIVMPIGRRNRNRNENTSKPTRGSLQRHSAHALPLILVRLLAIVGLPGTFGNPHVRELCREGRLFW